MFSSTRGERIPGGAIQGRPDRRVGPTGVTRPLRRLLLALLSVMLIGVSPVGPGVSAADAADLSETETLTPATPGGIEFGRTVAHYENVLAVARTGFDPEPAVDIFRRASFNDPWAYDETIDSPDGEPDFGRSLALRDGELAVGANGTIYWYFENSGSFDTFTSLTQPGEDFGAALAFDTVNGRLLVGAPEATPASLTTGVVYPVVIGDGGAEIQFANLIDPDGDDGDRFGAAIETALFDSDSLNVWIGSPGNDENGTDAGAVYLYTTTDSDSSYSFEATLNDFNPGDEGGQVIAADQLTGVALVVGASTGTTAYLYLGTDLMVTIGNPDFDPPETVSPPNAWIDIYGNTVAMGVPDGSSPTGGTVEIFVDDGSYTSFGTPAHVFTPSDTDSNDGVGSVVALDQDLKLIAAAPGFGSAEGQVYVTEIPDVTPPLPDVPTGLDVDAGWAAVGDPSNDVVYVARYQNGGWTETETLVGDPGTGFGAAIGMDRGVMAIGAPGANGLEGHVTIYRRGEDGTYNEVDTIDGPNIDGLFGYSVDVRGNLVTAGAPSDGFDNGAIVIAELDPATSTVNLETLLTATSGDDADFGSDVTIMDQGTVFVGVPGFDGDTGRVARFQLVAGESAGLEWEDTGELQPAGGAFRYGTSVASDDGRLVVAADEDDIWHYPDAVAAPTDVEQITNSGPADKFNGDVAVSGEAVAIAASSVDGLDLFSDLRFGTELESVPATVANPGDAVSVATDGVHQLTALANPGGATFVASTGQSRTASFGAVGDGDKYYSDIGSEQEFFGSDVALTDTTMAVLNPGAETTPGFIGSVEVLVEDEGAFELSQIIEPLNADVGSALTGAVALTENQLFILGGDQISNYVRASAADPFTLNEVVSASGFLLAASEGYVAVGDGGNLTVFEVVGGDLVEAAGSPFAISHSDLALAENWLVTADGESEEVEVRDLDDMSLVDTLTSARPGFGASVDVAANPLRVAVGGSASVEVREFDGGAFVTQLDTVATAPSSNLGFNLALGNDRLAVARVGDLEADPGALQLEAGLVFWTFDGANWNNVSGVNQPNQKQDNLADGIDDDLFAQSLAINDVSVAVGAPDEDETGEDAGAVFLFDVPAPPDPVDVTDLTINIFPTSPTVPVGASVVSTANLPPQATEGYGGGDRGIADTSLSNVAAANTGGGADDLLGQTDVDDLNLTTALLNGVLLSDIPIDGGWGPLLEGTPFENIPVQNITLGDVITAGVLDGVALDRLDLSATPVGAIPVGAIAIGDTPVGAIPLTEDQTVCDLAEELVPGFVCLDSYSLIDLGIRGVPVGAIPVGAIPVGAIDIAGTPVGAIPVGAIDLAATPVGAIPVGAIDLAATPVGAIPVGAIPVGAIPVGAIDLATTPVGAIPVGAITLGDLEATGIAGTPVGAIDISETPVGAIPIQSLPVGAIPVGAIGLESIPVGAIPVGAIEVNGSPVGAIPVGAIDLAASPVGAIPVGAIDVAGAPVGAIPVGAIGLGAIPVGAIAISTIPVGAIALTDIARETSDLETSALGTVPLAAIDPAVLATIVNCQLIDCDGDGTLADAAAAGALLPTATVGVLEGRDTGVRLADLVGVGGFSASDLGQQVDSLGPLTLADFLTFDDLILSDLPQNHPGFVGTTLEDLGPEALALITLQALVDGIDSLTGENLLTQLDGLTVADLINLNGMTLEDLIPSPPQEAFENQTLDGLLPYLAQLRVGDLVALFPALELDWEDVTLAQIPAETWADVTLEELANYGGTTLEELLGAMTDEALANLSLGDLLLAILGIDSYDWAELDLRSIDLPPAATVAIETFFQVTGGNADVRLQIILPPGSEYVDGSASLGIIPASTGVTGVNDPIVSGNQLEFRLGNVEEGLPYALTIEATAGLRLGNRTVEARGRVAGTDIEAGKRSTVAVVEAFEPNDVVADATPAETDTVYISHISSADDVDVFQIDLEEGARLALSLSDLPADYDLTVFGPVDEDPLVPLGNQQLIPTEPPRGVGFAGSENSNKPGSLADLPRQGGLPIISVSNQPDTETEIIDIPFVRRTGTYYIQVSGHSGAFSSSPYGLFVNVVPPAPPLTCLAQDFSSPANAGTVPSPAEMAGVNTLILTSQERLFAKYGADAQTAVNAMNDLVTYLDSTPALGLSAAVVSVEGDPTVAAALADLDGEACNPAVVNDAVREIAALIAELRDADPDTTIDNIIIVGDDDVVPFARLEDDTTIANETSFSWTFAGDDPTVANTLFGVADAGFYLSDEPYGDLDPIRSGRRTLFVTDTSLGRVLETPAEIAGQIATYIAFEGVLSPSTGFVSGYDFLDDGADAVADALDDLPDVNPVERLINETWGNPELDGSLFPVAGDAPGIAAINAHFDQYRALPADQNATGTEDDLYTTAQIDRADRIDSLIGRIIFSMGCHGGLNVPDQLFADADPRALDWAQAFGRHQAVYVANTGYGYGETEGVELSERLMQLFAQRLDGSVTVGEALLFAKQTYLGTRQAEYGPFDEKVLQQATFYGLPIYQVGVTDVPAPAPIPPIPNLAPLSGTDLAVNTVETDPSFERVDNPGGTSFEAVLGADDPGTSRQQSTPFAPILPTVSYDVSAVTENGQAPVAVAQGAFITELRTRDVPNIEPDIAKPIVDLIENEPEPEVSNIGTEPTVFVSNYRTPEGPRQQLSALAATFQSTEDDGTGTTRLFEAVEFEVFYRQPGTGQDQQPPVFGGIRSVVQAGDGSAFLVISTKVTDPSGVARVLALVAQDPGADTTWTPVELTEQGNDIWSGAVQITGSEIEFIVQALDGNGNVALSTNKAQSYLDDDQPDPGTETIDSAANRPPDAGVFYTAPVDVGADAGGEPLQYRVDNGPLVDGGTNPSVTLDPAELGDGAHTVTFILPNGIEESVTVLFDTTGPVITVSPDGGEVRSPVTIQYSCGDAAAGTESCVGLVDGDPVGDGDQVDLAAGPHTLTVNAEDTLGNPSSRTVTFTVINDVDPNDPDDDGIPNDGTDNCPDDANPGQEDGDGDGIGDACDPDPDDGPDGDPDDDGLTNEEEANLGTDPDDPDSDDDGINDGDEVAAGTDPLDSDDPGIVCTITGTPGNDLLRGTNGPDTICGLGGNDRIYGLGGDDILLGGEGNDRIYGGPGADIMSGGPGRDLLNGSIGADTIDGGDDRDTINAGGDNDVVRGGEGNDLINGGALDDLIYGGPGNDRILTGSGNDEAYGDEGNDSMVGSVGDDLMFGGPGNDRMTGGQGVDTLNGDEGDDIISGQNGNDIIDGGPDRDRCRGGRGIDVENNCEL